MSIHYEDLEAIICPVSMLDDDTYERMLKFKESGGQLQTWVGNKCWVDMSHAPKRYNSFPCRAKPEPKKMAEWHGVHLSLFSAALSLEEVKTRCARWLPDVYLRVERDAAGSIISVEVEEGE